MAVGDYQGRGYVLSVIIVLDVIRGRALALIGYEGVWRQLVLAPFFTRFGFYFLIDVQRWLIKSNQVVSLFYKYKKWSGYEHW